MAVFPYEVATVAAIAVFTLSSFSAAQVRRSHFYSTDDDDGPESEITCYGTVFDEDQAYLAGGAPQIETMAERCGYHLLNSKCGFRYRPPVLLFDGIYLINDNDVVEDPLYEAEIWSLQSWAQICNIKCRCTREYPVNQTLGAFPAFVADLTNYYEWNFDTLRSVQRNPRRHQRSYTLYGTNSGYRNHDMVPNDDDRPPLEISDQAFIGSRINRPSCDNGPRYTAGVPYREMPYDLYRFIHQTVNVNQDFRNPTEICLHELYGGRKGLNLGGVCLHPNGWPELTFPKNYRAPEFTSDYFGNLAGAAGEGAILLFCRWQCGCSGEPELGAKKKDAKQTLIASEKSLDPTMYTYTYQGNSEKLPKASELGDQQSAGKKAKTHHRNTCSALPCKGSTDCGTGCVCRLGSQYIDPRYFKLPTLAFECAAMAVSRIVANGVGASKNLGGKKMKRGASTDGDFLKGEFQMFDESVCACNATFVSASCCWSDNGLVWVPELDKNELKRDFTSSGAVMSERGLGKDIRHLYKTKE